MRVYGGLKREDWLHWGELTTFKTNAAELLLKRRTSGEVIYCSPLVDPWQPAERDFRLMPAILDALAEKPPAVFVIQTRSPSILLDLQRLRRLASRTDLRVSFSVTTDRDDIRRIYETHCESNYKRLEAMRELTKAGIRTFGTLAPLLPCDPERLANLVIDATREDLVGDPLHVRQVKKSGATTREAANGIAEHHGHLEWLDPEFQKKIVERIREAAVARGRQFGVGPEGFSWLSRTS